MLAGMRGKTAVGRSGSFQADARTDPWEQEVAMVLLSRGYYDKRVLRAGAGGRVLGADKLASAWCHVLLVRAE